MVLVVEVPVQIEMLTTIMLVIMMIPVVYLVRGQLIVHDCSKLKMVGGCKFA